MIREGRIKLVFVDEVVEQRPYVITEIGPNPITVKVIFYLTMTARK